MDTNKKPDKKADKKPTSMIEKVWEELKVVGSTLTENWAPRKSLVRVSKAWLQNWAAWTVLFFSMGIKALVNQVEQPFARSLTVCDVELDEGAYTGSKWCGDRLQVIQDGMYLSAIGQGQENFAMLCSLTLVIIITGIWGPRISLALGLTGVTLSVVLFVVACGSPSVGRSLFAMGQGLQGLYPIEYLMGILMLHMGIMPGADGEANFQLMAYMGILSNVFWNVILGSGVQLLELTDYRKIWIGILGVNVTVLLMVLTSFPKMRPIDADLRKSDVGPLTKIIREVLSYKDLLYDWRARRYMVKDLFEKVLQVYPMTIGPGCLMAYHGWSQSDMTIWFFPLQLVSLMCLPFYQKVLCSRFGTFNTYTWSVRYFIITHAVACVAVCFTDKFWLAWIYISSGLLSGFMPLKGFVDSRFAEPEQMQRFQSVQWVMGYFLGMWSGPMFVASFDATGATLLSKITPALILVCWVAGHYWAVFFLIYDMDGVQGWAVTVRTLDEGTRKGNMLWWLIAEEKGNTEFAVITEEKWHVFQLESFLGRHFHECQGPIFLKDHWMAIIGSMNQTPSQGAESLARFDAAIAHAESLYRAAAEHEAKQGIEHAASNGPAAPAAEYPDLEGEWVPVRPEQWFSPEDAASPASIEVWDRAGNGFFNNPNCRGILRVVNRNENEFLCWFKMETGDHPGTEGVLRMNLLPDGTRHWPEAGRVLGRKRPQEAPAEDLAGLLEEALAGVERALAAERVPRGTAKAPAEAKKER